jgi:SWI/SNF-related matrix-associated actin-dependent regulator 1 of chromatin subfamily A
LRVIDAAKDVIYARSIVDKLLTNCEKISQKMEDQVAHLINRDEETNIKHHRKQLELKSQPKNLNESLSLKPYQLIGLNWLCLIHKEGINGILADEMGLGKTCQTIAFLAHLFEQNPKLMHLIVVPPSTLDNWVREISTWCPTFNFTVYQGSLDERRELRFDVLNNRFAKPLNAILTSYGMLSSSNEDKAFFRKLTLEYCIYDEAHMLKNMNSIRYQSLIKINSKRRLLLTGTPLQNNLVELMSLLYFVMPDMFQHKTDHLKKIFETKPVDVDKDTFYNDKITQAKGIMKPFIMRRLKADVLKQLPQKIIHVEHCEQSERQLKEYLKLIDVFRSKKADEKQKTNDAKAEKKAAKAEKRVKSVEESNELKKLHINIDDDTSKAGHILMELRKAANHPLLRRSIYDDDKLKKMAKLVTAESSADTVFAYVLEDMSVMSDFQLHKLCHLYRCLKSYELTESQILDSGKFVILDKLLKEKIGAGSRVLIFSQFVIMLDILEEFLKLKSYKYCRLDGSTAISERQDLIDDYNDKESEMNVFLLSTKAGGMGINLTAANVVIMHDIDYNPFNDKQAEDRCHRVGQTKTVEVYKLISKESIDETMLKIQTRKLELDSDIAGDNEAGGAKVDMVSMLNDALKIKE